jgi:hypothetical protein
VRGACLESNEPTSLEVGSEAEHEEVPKEKPAVEASRTLKKQHGDWYLAVRHHGQPKKWTHDNGGSWKKLAAAHKGMTYCAGVAECKGHGHIELTVKQRQQEKQTTENVARGT